MEENELKDAFWTPLFIVAGFSFLFFGGIMALFDSPHAGLFLKVGILGLIVGVLSHVSDRYFKTSVQGQGMHTPESPAE